MRLLGILQAVDTNSPLTSVEGNVARLKCNSCASSANTREQNRTKSNKVDDVSPREQRSRIQRIFPP